MSKRPQSKKATDARWDEAVDWLLNSRHTADPGIQDPFWAYVDGVINRAELETFGWRDVEERKAELKAQQSAGDQA